MKSLSTLFFYTTLILIVACSSSSTIPSASHQRWANLGSKIVNYGVDRDEMKIGFREGKFNSVKLVVKRAPVNIHKCVIYFGNGDSQILKIKKHFQKGSSSIVHDLNGTNRIITKVVFWYDTKNKSRSRAKVELWANT